MRDHVIANPRPKGVCPDGGEAAAGGAATRLLTLNATRGEVSGLDDGPRRS
jgi:hypothetical protein